jgi:hypothetical protein
MENAVQTLMPRAMQAIFAICIFGLTMGKPVSGATEARSPLIGTWKLVSWQVVAEDGAPQDIFGKSPNGYLVLTPEGRSIVVTTAGGRRGGMDDASRIALHKSMLAYSGRYRVEGDDFITTVDISWNEEWNGTEQRRHYRIEGDKLTIESAPAPSIVFPGKSDFRRLVWVRER